MRRSGFSSVLIVLGILLLAGAAPPTAKGQVVLLNNGNVLSGDLASHGDRCEITSEGAVIELAAAEVAWTGTSLVAAYEFQRRQLASPTAADHLRLAEWCLRQQLWPQAARELLDARGLDPHHPRLALVDRRLALAGERMSDKKKEQPNTAAANRPSRQAQRVAADSQAAALEALAATLPDGALQEFTRRVQPILVNNCTTAGCHSESDQQQFRLSRALLHDMGNRTDTLQNLAATVEQIHRHQPEASPLLAAASGPHGGLTEGVFPPHRQELYEHLHDWVRMTSEEPTTATSDVATHSDSPVADLPVLVDQRPVTTPSVYAELAEQVRETSGVSPPPQVGQYQPRDPFDPEVFNRGLDRSASRDSKVRPAIEDQAPRDLRAPARQEPVP